MWVSFVYMRFPNQDLYPKIAVFYQLLEVIQLTFSFFHPSLENDFHTFLLRLYIHGN